jgi:WD40 repeat protein
MFRFHAMMAFLLFVGSASAQEANPRTDTYGDPLPAGALRRLGTVRFRQQYVHDMAFTPDGKTLVVAGADYIVQWDVSSGKPLRTIPISREGDRYPLGLSRDGTTVSFRSDHQTVVVQELATAKERFRKKIGQFPGGMISPDKSMIAIGTRDGSSLWDIQTGEQRGKMPKTYDLKYSPDGKWLAGWCREERDEPIILFNAMTGQEQSSFKHPEYLKNRDASVMTTYGFTPDGRSLVVSWWAAGIMIYDLKTQKLSRHIETDAHFVAASPDGKMIVANKDRVVILLSADTGKEIRRWEMSDTTLVQSYGAFSPDGKTLALGFECGVQLWDPETGKRLDRFLDSVHIPRYLSASNDAKMIAVLFGAHAGQFLQLFNAETLQEKARIDSKPFTLECLAFSPDGRRLAFVEWPIIDREKHPAQTRILDAASGIEMKPKKKIAGYFSHWKGNDAIIVTQGDWTQAHWVNVDVANGEERDRMPIPSDHARYRSNRSLTEPRQMVVVNERRLGAPDDDGRMFLAEWPSGKRIRPLVFAQTGPNERHSGARKEVQRFSPDGRLVLITDIGRGPLTILETATGRARFQIKPGKPEEYDVRSSYSPDGRLIVISREDKHTIMDSLTFEPLMEWMPKTYGASSLAFSANGQIMVTGDTSTATVWDLNAALRPRMISPDKLSAADLAKLWLDLENTDAQVGHRAMITLYRRPDDAVAYLKTKLPASLPDKATFQRLVRELDDPNLKNREAAHNAIIKMGDGAGAMIREAMKESPSLETNRRLAVLADKLKVTDAVRIRWLRCVELLERIGTPPARAVLEQFRNVSDAETSADATRSLDRLAVMAR